MRALPSALVSRLSAAPAEGRARGTEKGGARALLVLKKALNEGKTAAMIADIPHGTPRDSGFGVILLAKLSGRPILPICYLTTRRKVLEKSWDKTTNTSRWAVAQC